MSYKVCILSNEDNQSHLLWEKAVVKSGEVDSYKIVNLSLNNWIEEIRSDQFDLLLLKPPGKTEQFKRLYDERVLLIQRCFDIPIYPSLNEILIYENKRFLRDWLKIRNIPHPTTNVFFDKQDAMNFIINNDQFPIVGKTNIGASGNGVEILKSSKDALAYVNIAFKKGIKPRSGPKLGKGSIFKKVQKVLKGKGFLKQRLKDYHTDFLNNQYHFVILQEYIKHQWEWRCVRIGDSFFAHKKIVKGEMASGKLIKSYDSVPFKLLDFIRNVSEENGLSSVAIDVFEQNEGYLVNEIQCFFGQSDPYQMLVDGKPGRYIYKEDKWIFEEGMFNTNESYDLRLQHALSMLNNKSQ